MGLDMSIIHKSKPHELKRGRRAQTPNMMYREYYDKEGSVIGREYTDNDGAIKIDKNFRKELIKKKPASYIDVSEVAYWRKANAIHKWFVDNVQDGDDNCGTYLLTKKNIEELSNKVNYLLDNIVLKKGKVVNGYRMKKNIFGKLKEKPNMVKGIVIKNADICEKTLPLCDGFFFGYKQYNEYYYEDLKYTKEVLDKLLEYDIDKESYYYTSSW